MLHRSQNIFLVIARPRVRLSEILLCSQFGLNLTATTTEQEKKNQQID